MLGLTYIMTERLSATATYNYYLSSVKQDLLIDLGGSPAVSPDTVYEDKVNGLSLDLNYLASEKLTARAGVYHSVSEGRFETHNIDSHTYNDDSIADHKNRGVFGYSPGSPTHIIKRSTSRSPKSSN